jgi:hypothetical protein
MFILFYFIFIIECVYRHLYRLVSFYTLIDEAINSQYFKIVMMLYLTCFRIAQYMRSKGASYNYFAYENC